MDFRYIWNLFSFELTAFISIISLLSQVPRNGTLKSCTFLMNKKTEKAIKNNKNVYLNSVLLNDPLVVERFLETMELWHL
jgi:hypothetical protein